MTEKSGNFVAPILRLDAFAWSTISYYFESGDVIRLYCIGSRVLSDRLGQGVRHLQLRWQKRGYIRFDQVLASFSLFKAVLSLEFDCSNKYALYNVPIEWSQLPQQLTTLKLSFFDAHYTLFANEAPFTSWPPSIEVIDIRDTTPYSSDLSKRSVDLSHLSSLSLRQLKLSADHRPLLVPPSQIELLPATLEALSLGIMIEMSHQLNEDLLFTKLRFPSLPPNLKLLCIKGRISLKLHIDTAQLPSSLTHFELEYGFNVGDYDHSSSKTIDFTGARTILTNLQTFLVPHLRISVDEALELLPPSLTLLSVHLSGKLDSLDKDDQLSICSKLVDCYVAPDQFVGNLDGSIPFTQLKTLELNTDEFSVIPSSVTRLGLLNCVNSAPLPQGLEILVLEGDSESALETFIFGSCLHSLYLDCILSEKSLDFLPNSLTVLKASIPHEPFSYLLKVMSLTTKKLPHLHKITNKEQILPEFTEHFPTQLRKLVVNFVDFRGVRQTPMAIPPLSSSFLKALQSSSLKSLAIDMRAKSTQYAHSNFQLHLLQNLPKNLTSLRFHTYTIISPFDPIIFPSSLKKLVLYGRISPKDLTSVKLDAHPNGPFSLILPPTLEQFHLTNYPFVRDPAWYPPQLSQLRLNSSYDFATAAVVPQYWASRDPRLHNPDIFS